MTTEYRDLDRAVDTPLINRQRGKSFVAAKESPIEAATRKLLSDLNQGHTDHYKEVLGFYGRLHAYSFWNSMLIMAEKPDARAVASYKRWQELGRQVRKGAIGVLIYVPVFRKEKDELRVEHQTLTGFTRGRVFSDRDLVDIDTNPLPDLWKVLPDDAHALYAALTQKVAAATQYRLRECDVLYFSAKGECDHTNRRISILRGMDTRTKCMVLLHECVHALFHGERARGMSRHRKEWEAESVSYVLSTLIGLESEHSRDYLLNWQGTAEELKQSMSTIHGMCREAIDKLDLRVAGA